MGVGKSIDCIGSHEPSAFGGATSRRAQPPTFTKANSLEVHHEEETCRVPFLFYKKFSKVGL